MNRKILTVAIACFSCLLLITSFAVADGPKLAAVPEWVDKKLDDRELKKAERAVERETKKAEKEAKKAERKAAKEAKKAEREAAKAAKKAEKVKEKGESKLKKLLKE